MSNQKLENMLNLALETPEGTRKKTENLNVGFYAGSRTWELIVKYNGDLSELKQMGITVEELIAGYAILNVPEELVEIVGANRAIEYVEKPKRLFFAVSEGKRASCILPVTIRAPYLTGEGTLIAVIDSGIDYRNNLFRRLDGTTRIRYLWDQSLSAENTDAGPPDGFTVGAEFTADRINEALAAGSREEAFRIVPSLDVSGHGTAVAGIAAGNGREAGISYQGVAPESELIVVKLGSPGETSFPRTTELMRALVYVVRRAQELSMPLAVNLSFGNTYGAHNGNSLLERFIDNVSEIGRNVICVGAGNEGADGGHVQGRLGSEEARIELAVGSYERVLNVQLWKNYADQYRVTLISPGGQRTAVPTLSENAGKSVVIMEQTQILIYLGEPTPYATVQEIYFDFIPQGTYITPGIWTFTLEAVVNVTGQYYFYLPSAAVRNQTTRFYASSPDVTLTIPSTSSKVISVGAYDPVYESYADFSGRGYVYENRTVGLVLPGGVKPDLAAPGVNITAPDVRGGFLSMTGTSFATPFVSGAAALMMEWGIVRGNDPFLYGEKVKAYLRKGAKPIRGETEYPNARVGYGALCLENSLPG
ncbi:MAG: S8 family peptidase [Lachnospiraceae bacterium]|nr:S8 family peptidase [Lachnospiraceae bacterium]